MVKALELELETASKSIMDKERQIKSDKMDIQHHEGTNRNNKTKIQELLEQLSHKETENMNSAKTMDNLQSEIKRKDI